MISHNEYEIQGLKGPVKQLKEQHFNAFENDGLAYIGKPLEDYHHFNNRLILFDDQHKVLETKFLFLGKINKQVFDSDGDILEDISYNSENENIVVSRYIHNYSDDKLIDEELYYNDKNELATRYINTRDSLKRCTEVIAYNTNNEMVRRSVWEYNGEFKTPTKFTEYNADGIRSISENKLNQLGHTYEVINYDQNGNIKETKDFRYLYNDDGTLKKNSQKDEIIHRHTVVLEEDKYGNWIKKLIHYKQKPVYIYLRNYIYFNDEETSNNLNTSNSHYNKPLTLQNPKIVIADYWDARHHIEKLGYLDGETIPDLNNYQLQMVVEKSLSADKFSYFAYYAATYNFFPSQIAFKQSNIEVLALLNWLQDMFDVCILHTDCSYDGGSWKQEMNSYTIKFYDHPAYILHASNISLCNEDEYDFPANLTNYPDHDFGYISLGKVTILNPPISSGKRDKDFERLLSVYINDCQVEDKPEQPYIHIVEVANNNFQIIRHPINNNFEIRDLDINYGYGFEQFHNELMMRFKGETKGLVLFHGLPGTGKTYYIRHLLREMANANKVVIYMPPNMVDYLTEPSFLTFLSRTVKNYSTSNQFCVLLIEDAEPLLAQRESESRIQGVTNLLNMTDGLLNDMLKLQMICTFNVELSKLDAALLRPGRLIARKEFKPLSVLDANRLAQRLGIKKEIKKPTTLSQIYAMIEGKNTIIHNPNEHE